MHNEAKEKFNIGEIRDLARRFVRDELESCMEMQISGGANACIRGRDSAQIMSALAKANFIRAQMDAGQSMNAALRELGKRMRAFQNSDGQWVSAQDKQEQV